jgi:hypothetical protein
LRISFSGEKNGVYLVNYPNALRISLGGGEVGPNPDKSVAIYGVSSSHAAGIIPGDGSAVRTGIGATRAQLRATQEAGQYSGALPLTIVYP